MELHKMHSPRNRFSQEEKTKAVKMYLSGQHTKMEKTTMFGVSYAALDYWIRRFGPDYVEIENELLPLELEFTLMELPDSENLLRRIKDLENKLELANLKAELLDTMIDIAEEELHIPIRKKYGPQPSKGKHKSKK
jgi:transposase-like protein